MSRIKTTLLGIYPYLYMICLAIYFFLCDRLEGVADIQDTGLIVILAIAIICNIYALYAVISTVLGAVKGKLEAKKLAKSNMIIKLVHIPAYIFHFVLGMIGLVASVWGIGFILWAILIDILTIALTGTIGLSASICSKREGKITGSSCIKYSILSYIYCADVVCAVLLNKKSK